MVGKAGVEPAIAILDIHNLLWQLVYCQSDSPTTVDHQACIDSSLGSISITLSAAPYQNYLTDSKGIEPSTEAGTVFKTACPHGPYHPNTQRAAVTPSGHYSINGIEPLSLSLTGTPGLEPGTLVLETNVMPISP